MAGSQWSSPFVNGDGSVFLAYLFQIKRAKVYYYDLRAKFGFGERILVTAGGFLEMLVSFDFVIL
jgi:hypothetical protein